MFLYKSLYLLGRRPYISKEDRPAACVRRQRLSTQIDPDSAGDGERDNQGGRCQKIRANGPVYPRLEIAITGQDRCCGYAIVRDRPLDCRMEGPAIADAGCTTECGKVESQSLEMIHQTAFIQVVDDHL